MFKARMNWMLVVLLSTGFIASCGDDSGGGGDGFRVEYKAVATGQRPPAYPTPNFRWPVDRVSITRGYRPERDRDHEGIDLRGIRGTPIKASQAARVIYAGTGVSGYGRMVLLEHDTHWETLYGHMQTILVQRGEIVHAGQSVGTMGNSGRSTGVHLHFEIIRNGITVNPYSYLPRPTPAR